VREGQDGRTAEQVSLIWTLYIVSLGSPARVGARPELQKSRVNFGARDA
jgi:hypothetical protein